MNFGQNNKRERCNKRGGWQKSPQKLINREVGINRRLAKTVIRNFIEIKSSNDLGKISTKRT